MPDIASAKTVLKALGIPVAQQNDIAALTLLALCRLRPEDDWQAATRSSMTISKGIMAFIRDAYGRSYAPNTRETFRRQVLHQFVQGQVVDYNPDDPALPTNSPKAHYAISQAALDVILTFDTAAWGTALEEFRAKLPRLTESYQVARQSLAIPVLLPGGEFLYLSPGAHNQLQAQVIAQFLPQFAPDAVLLYLGDTADKDLFVATDILHELGIPVTQHDKLPDILAYSPARGWLFLIEVVTSHGPVTPQRAAELKALLKDCKAGLIFVSAFPSFTEFRNYLREIAWETEIWIAEAPAHLIHFDGDRFLGPHPANS